MARTRKAAIIGAGQTRYGDFPELSIKELFTAAYREAVTSVDSGLDPSRIQAAYVGTLGTGGFQLGQPAPLLMGHVGLPSVPAVRVENACASGGFALHAAATAISAGLYDVILVAGVEKMRDVSAAKSRYWLGVSGDTEYERLAGLTFAGIYALLANRYLHEYRLDRTLLSMVAVKNHRHGAGNPKAQFRKEINLDDALRAPMVAEPLNVYDCCPTSDGAAVVILAAADVAREFTDSPVYIAGFGAASDYLAIHDRACHTSLRATVNAARSAYEMAGMKPVDIHLAEVHDCFTIAEVLAYEDLGFCGRGGAAYLLENADTSLGGRIPVNVSGGLKSKGHPLGATGVGQAYEVFHQLRGEAQMPARQVKGATTALTHNVGGSGGTATVFIYSVEGGVRL
ncbi:MAG: thiolase domain-containing protein [Ignavibacteriales bacterium]